MAAARAIRRRHLPDGCIQRLGVKPWTCFTGRRPESYRRIHCNQNWQQFACIICCHQLVVMCPLCWPFWWPLQCGGTIPHTSPDGGDSWRHRASTRSDSINRTRLPLILGLYFIFKSLKRSSSCPNKYRGLTYHSDEKHLNNMSESFVGVANIAFNRYNSRFVLRVIKQ